VTRYLVVRTETKPYIAGVVNVSHVIPHPEQPPEGFPFATAANIFCVERNLDGSWYVIPVEGTR